MPVELSYKNHFQFGYNFEPYVLRQNPNDQWWVSYGVCTEKPLSFAEECIRTAHKIRSNTDQPLWVLFSGGVDSEVVLQSFVRAQIEVQAAILRFHDDLNLHDISYAIMACEKLNVPYKIFDLDLMNFWETELWNYSTPTRCVSPQLLTTMYLADQVNGYPIIGSGECYLVKDLSNNWSLWEKEKIASWYRHFLIQKKPACPGFFQYTPELILSYLSDPMVEKLTQNIYPNEVDTQNRKLEIYQQHFDLIPRPKFTGFEKVQDQDYIHRQKLKSAFPDSDQVFKTPLSTLKNNLLGRVSNAQI